ncbi:Type 11 methyltransferase [Candidatus Methylopumilus planktonicus]|uniref:Type 11 methyltransferase n=1 Tax=Candidatus Methylopumilus planktonicus TaxID=1581557 RepID=A0A0D6EWQ7_9PROT|nr:class I SAM-dependent methyltransferase [Candidatus Methylopumilus planktonicus]CEZ19713.1 Type 11 methyltransferase [Candidatus Methylopumilus planktonicus]
MPKISPQEWFKSPLGQYLLALEYDYINPVVMDTFGFYAIQMGNFDIDFLDQSRIQNKFSLNSNHPDLMTSNEALPFDEASVDLLIAPHILEQMIEPYELLKEIHRVLMPEGRLIITGFNPVSLWGIKRLLSFDIDYPWNTKFISLSKIKEWLPIVGLEMIEGKMGCYVPPIQQESWLRKIHAMEKLGDRWWPMLGGFYSLVIQKRVHGMNAIQPLWKKKLIKTPVYSAQRSRTFRLKP